MRRLRGLAASGGRRGGCSARSSRKRAKVVLNGENVNLT